MLKLAVMSKLGSRLTQGPETSLVRDFLAGVDPTGSATFQGALRNRQRHAAHQAAGIAGGAAAGATVLPALTLGMVEAARTPGGLKTRAAAFLRGAASPFRKIVDATRAKRVLSQAAKTGYIQAGKKDAASINRLLENVPGSEAIKRRITAPKVLSKRLAEGKRVHVPGAQQKAVQAAADAMGAQRARALGVLGTGGVINAGSAAYQYRTGQRMQRVLDEEERFRQAGAKSGTPI